jgi:hypothetical protein
MYRYCKTVIALLASAMCGSAAQNDTIAKMDTPASDEVIEILTLDVKPGKRDEFHKIYAKESLPLLRKWKIDVIAYGPSLHDANSYYIIRSFKSLEERQRSEDAFYASDDWKNGPKAAILALVDHFAYTVVSAERLKEVTKTL